MLQLKNIVKTYIMGKKGGMEVKALKGVSLEFRKNEFVSILGPSGCGKTTMLNIIGGLDRYTNGDLVINEVSTKEYKDVDWDIYRNNSIGFVFQTYNLISHQTVFSNVELALTLAGESRAERHKRVVEVLKKVGLADQIYKKPTQMSGGQMQRVAIARALVNNPKILLADEPTGALDSETSVQIMELLKEIAKDRLVIMVTHNSSLAETYSTRIIRLLDGKVIDDTSPYSSRSEAQKKEKEKRKKVSMSFLTALSLSFNNLLTKKTRTLLTAFAGSIGIIGIALILSLSSGMQNYVTNLERDTLSTFPIELESRAIDMGGMMSAMMNQNRIDRSGHDPNYVYANDIISNMMDTLSAQIQRNDLAAFMRHIESDARSRFYDYTTTIQYRYDIELQIFSSDVSNGIVQVNPSTIMSDLGMGGGGLGGMSPPGGGFSGGMGMSDSDIWVEMLDNHELLSSQYDVIAGRWATAYDEIVLVVNSNNEISDINLYALGLLDSNELEEMIDRAMNGFEFENTNLGSRFSFDDILSLTYRLVLNTDLFVRGEDGDWEYRGDDDDFMREAIENALELRVVGIIRPSLNAAAASINGTVGYTSALIDYVINAAIETEIAQEQLADPETNVLTGFPFDFEGFMDDMTIEQFYGMIGEMLDDSTEEEQEAAWSQIAEMTEGMTDDEILEMLREQARAMPRTTFEDVLALLGVADFNNPSAIRLFPQDFNSKQQLEELIAEYNQAHIDAGNDEYVIHYTDFIGLMTSSISDIIGIISYVLIAFVAISLIVSSIMIAIITYISVLERTKEIGILRSIGASKKDITRVFNAETIIEGFVAGTMGVLITLLLNIPINAIISSLVGVSGLSVLPIWGAVGLIVISVVLTVIAGFIPSKMAAKKDPVVALRTE
ncbi:MAG: ABC transporter ATP-binding protein/permease [Oscillospiraceae bacterium]|nr:ABC transporter ATP-binding protein/permease [Oscillospiraceae bacterium]